MDQAIDIALQICEGLAVAHQADPPIVHRDIKPMNLLVGFSKDGLRVQIADFGLAKHANPLTLLVSAQGTPAFFPPESFSKTRLFTGWRHLGGGPVPLLVTN